MTGPSENAIFAAIFANPSIEEMLNLSPGNFEKFVAYVFQKSGYITSHVALRFLRGVDIEIFHPLTPRMKLGGIEVKRFKTDHLVDLPTIQKLMGAPAVRGNTPAYLVTTSNFNSPAINMAKTNNKVRLINGTQFIRYINYINGSISGMAANQGIFLSPDTFSHKLDIKNKKPTNTKVLVVGNNKGGVGKSTTSEYLAHAIAEQDKRVLLIDLDPQANLSERILAMSTNIMKLPHLEDYFYKTFTLDQLVRQVDPNGKIYLIPSTSELSKLDSGGVGQPQHEVEFVLDFYETFFGSSGIYCNFFDWVIFDTPPATSMFTRLALATANYIIVPIRLRPSSLAGTGNVLAASKTMGALVGNTPRLIGGLVTHWNDDAASNDNVEPFNLYFRTNGSRLLTTRIPFDVTIEKAANKLASKAFAAYKKVIEEMDDYVKGH